MTTCVRRLTRNIKHKSAQSRSQGLQIRLSQTNNQLARYRSFVHRVSRFRDTQENFRRVALGTRRRSRQICQHANTRRLNTPAQIVGFSLSFWISCRLDKFLFAVDLVALIVVVAAAVAAVRD